MRTCLILLVIVLLSGCASFRDNVIDAAADFPVTDAARDWKTMTDEVGEAAHQERVSELSSDLDEFMQDDGQAAADDGSQSVLKKKDQ